MTAPVAVAVDEEGILVLEQGKYFNKQLSIPPTLLRYPLGFQPLIRAGLGRTDLGPLGNRTKDRFDSQPIDMVLDREVSPNR